MAITPLQALAVSKKYTEDTIIGEGAIKGNPGVSITNAVDNGDGSFYLTKSDGTRTADVKTIKGEKGDKGDPGAGADLRVDELKDVTITEIQQDDILMYDENADGWVNKSMPTIPTKTSDLNNDAKFQTEDDVATTVTDYAVKKEDGKSLVSDTDITQIGANKTAIETLNGTGDGSVDKKIATALGELTYLSKVIATKTQIDEYIADPTKAKFNVIYLLKDDAGKGDDKYFEYQRLGDATASEFAMTGSTSTDLSNYATLDDLDDKANQTDFEQLADKVAEIELFKFPNAIIVGEPTINHGQISDFSATSYLKFPFLVNFQNRNFEIIMEITTGANVVDQENVFDSDYGLAFAIRNSKFVIAISGNGTSWNLGEGVGSYTVQPNTTYMLKLSWDKLTYKLDYSVDGGKTYINDINKVAATQPYPKQIFIGVGETFATVVNHFTGSINLNKASVKIGTEIIWQGMDDAGLATRLATDLENIDADGIAKVKEIAGTVEALPSSRIVLGADTNSVTEINGKLEVDTVNAKGLDNKITFQTGSVEFIADVNVRGDLTLGDSTLKATEFEAKGGDFVITDDGQVAHKLSEKMDKIPFMSTESVYGSTLPNQLNINSALVVKNFDNNAGKMYNQRNSWGKITRNGINLGITSIIDNPAETRTNYLKLSNSRALLFSTHLTDVKSDNKARLIAGEEGDKGGKNKYEYTASVKVESNLRNYEDGSHGRVTLQNRQAEITLNYTGIDINSWDNSNVRIGRMDRPYDVHRRDPAFRPDLTEVYKQLFQNIVGDASNQIRFNVYDLTRASTPYQNKVQLRNHAYMELGGHEAKLMYRRYDWNMGFDSEQGIKVGPYEGVQVYGDLMRGGYTTYGGYQPLKVRGGLSVRIKNTSGGDVATWEFKGDGIYCNGIKKISV